MGARRSVGAQARAVIAGLWLVACSAGVERRACLDPTNEGACFCPLGASCEHRCGPAVGHCTLGCSQGNGRCGVTCADDCVALCTGATSCEAHCGERCNVSCAGIRERCIADIGPNSTVDCEGGRDCQVSCKGACTVACSRGHCRVRCAAEQGCELECGMPAPKASGKTSGDPAYRDGLQSCPDGSRVCGQPC